MKKVLYLFVAGLLILGPMSCKKDEPAGPSLASAPEATADNDTKSGGIYKGVIIGSTGTIKVVLQGGKKEIILKIDNVTKTLTTTALDGWTSGQEIAAAVFTSGDWSVTLSLDADGAGGSIDLNIPGHASIVVTVLKEYSNAQIKAFEGRYAGTSAGTWNFILQGNNIYGISFDDQEQVSSYFSGELSGTAINISILGSNTTATGTLNANGIDCSGEWSASTDVHGTWTGARTL